MNINRDIFKNKEKNIKRYHNEKENLAKIILHIKQCDNFKALSNHPISIMYGFEALKYQFSGKYSFNLSKRGGVIRLIVSVNQETNTVILEDISMKHYNDLKRK